ncbi:D-arabinose 5-phosphate isomerase [Chromatiales bacterium (ex Bugula neritina AB1)]|nr:D-arabinose 5-phosphate isomerase [Chromatiales bacterium (ex Bugula neritina AB1)]
MNTIKVAREVFATEAQAISALAERVAEEFSYACELLFNCTGRVVVCGVGKSGHIANKIAATLASTGTPAFFVHPTEASHGDFGMIRPEDVVIAISYSGEADELKVILPLLKRSANPIIALTGRTESSLAKTASVSLDVSVEVEACPLGLAPTSSTTATLAMGDALAIAVLQMRGFSESDFALTHPGGALGRKLMLQVADIMVTGDEIPLVSIDTSLKNALCEMSAGKLGFLIIADKACRLSGVFSDGDLRRALDRDIDIGTTTMGELMTPGGKTIHAEQLAVEALSIMEDKKIYALAVVDQNDRVCGALNMHSLLKAGVV